MVSLIGINVLYMFLISRGDFVVGDFACIAPPLSNQRLESGLAGGAAGTMGNS